MEGVSAASSGLFDRVVVIEDEAPLREILAYIISSEGFEVVTAGDGAEGFAALKKHKPKVAIVDVAMPRMDGFSVCRAIRRDAELCDCFVIMASAYDGRANEIAAYEAGANIYLQKPVAEEDLLATIRNVLAAEREPEPRSAGEDASGRLTSTS
jgi:DNA-binding response OmpR family regulator